MIYIYKLIYFKNNRYSVQLINSALSSYIANMKRANNFKYKVNSKLKSEVVDSLKLPKDIILGAVILNVTGQGEAFVENYRGIIEYTDESIVLQTKTCMVSITGKSLSIDYYTNDEMKITGHIMNIQYSNN